MRWRLALLVCTCAFLLPACEEKVPPGPERPGELRVAVWGEIKGLDPTQADEESSATCVVNVYDQLFEHHPWNRPYELRPCLAASLPEISPDGLMVTLRLKPGVRFQDDVCFKGGLGREVVAADVAFCLLRLMDAHVRSPWTWLLEGRVRGLDAFRRASEGKRADPHRTDYGWQAGYPEVPGLTVADARTLVIGLTEPFPELGWLLAMPALSIYPPEAVGRYGVAFREHAVTTGPYRVESFAPERMVLVKCAGYREDLCPDIAGAGDLGPGAESLPGQRLPLNDRVVVEALREDGALWSRFLAGGLDRSSVPKAFLQEAVDPATGDLAPALTRRGVRLERQPRLEIIYDVFNFNDPVVGAKAGEKGRALRRAMSLAVDRQWATEHLYNGRVVLVQGPLLAEFPEHDPGFHNPWQRGADETMGQARQRARQVLADAGMPEGAGVPEIEVDVVATSVDEEFFKAFQADMRTIGLRLRAYPSTWQEQIKRQRESSYQVVGLSWGADYPAAQNFLQLFFGPNRAPGVNSANYANPEVDVLYRQSAHLPEGPERTALFRRIERLVVEDCPWIFRYRRVQWTLLQPWLTGSRYNDLVPKTFKTCRVGTPKPSAGAGAPGR